MDTYTLDRSCWMQGWILWKNCALDTNFHFARHGN